MTPCSSVAPAPRTSGDHGGPRRREHDRQHGRSGAIARPADRRSGAARRPWPGGILLLQGNFSAETTGHALERGGARRLRRIANAAPVAFPWGDLQAHVDVLVVNAVEAGLVGPLTSDAVIVTEGASGATLIQGERRWHVGPPRLSPRSTPPAPATCCAACSVAALERRCRCSRRWSVPSAAA